MKKILIFLIVLMTFLLIVSCGKKEVKEQSELILSTAEIESSLTKIYERSETPMTVSNPQMVIENARGNLFKLDLSEGDKLLFPNEFCEGLCDFISMSVDGGFKGYLYQADGMEEVLYLCGFEQPNFQNAKINSWAKQPCLEDIGEEHIVTIKLKKRGTVVDLEKEVNFDRLS